MKSDGPQGLTPGCYLVSDKGGPEEETLRLTEDEFRAVLAKGVAKEHHPMPRGYRLADLKRGLIARIDHNNQLVIEPKGTRHEENRRSRDRYAPYDV